MLSFSFSFKGMEEILQNLKKVESMRGQHEIIAEALVAGVRRNIDDQLDPDTLMSWPPLKYRDGKALEGLKGGIDYRLVNQYAFRIFSDSPWSELQQKGGTIDVGSGFMTFKVFGKTVRAHRVTIPARKFIPETDEGFQYTVGDTLEAKLQAHLLRMVGD